MTEIERVLVAAERLVAMLKDPHPGLFTWEEVVARTRAEIATENKAVEKEAYEHGFAAGRHYEANGGKIG